jgi:O-antigen/teichoic acid export membrane protein
MTVAKTEEWRRLALTLGGEGMQSGLHFALNLLLIALMPARDYGTFAFVLVLGGVGLTYLRSLTALPASTFIGRAASLKAADFYEGAFGAAALLMALTLGAIGAVALTLTGGDGGVFPGAAVVALWALRSHMRTVGFARGRPGAVTLGDAAFAASGALASGAALGLDPDRLQGVLLALAFANAAGIAALAGARRAWPRADFGRRARTFYLRLARRLLWSLYGVTTTILQGQGVAFLVVGVAGTAGYAPIAAMLNLFAPLRILAMSLANLLQPEISRLAAAGDDEGWRTLRHTWTVRAALIALVYGDAGFLALPHVHLRSIQGQPVMLVAVFAWALYAMVLAYLMPRILLEARMRYRDLALIFTLGAAVTLAATLALLRIASPSYAILGGVLGESVAAVATWRMAAGSLRGALTLRPLSRETEPVT